MISEISVSQLNAYIKSILDGDRNLKSVFVVGEISNLTIHYKSGHVYLSLKDEKSVIKAVMFSSSAKRLKFRPTEGMKVLVRGRVSVYEGTGQYQLYIDDMQPDGLGSLNLAYEQLWEKLNKSGVFDENYKKNLPLYPYSIGVITSPKGAAVHDIFTILERRWPLAKVNLYPCSVQGINAESELISALINADSGKNDVIIIGRGGGSTEDLWSFNSEKLAMEIYNAETPVISAVGHENDFTICDYVADLRAPTPSAAAEMATPDINEERNKLGNLTYSIKQRVNYAVQNNEMKLDNLSVLSDKFKIIINRKYELFDATYQRFKSTANLNIERQYSKLNNSVVALDSLNPTKVLLRGYTILEKDGKTISSVKQIQKNDEITAILSDGKINLKCE